jgi:hypothetical protein
MPVELGCIDSYKFLNKKIKEGYRHDKKNFGHIHDGCGGSFSDANHDIRRRNQS